MQERRAGIFTVPNFFSILRMLLVIPIFYFLRRNTEEGDILAFSLMLVAALTDFLDGFLARRLRQQSDAGRILDPVADKVAVGIVAIILARTHDLPLWFLILIIGRDLAILLFAPFIMARRHLVPESNWYGKVAVTAVAIVLILYTLRLAPWNLYALYISVALVILSAASYITRLSILVRKER